MNKRNAGFTLIEAMVSLFVLGAALVILTPDYPEIIQNIQRENTIERTSRIANWMRDWSAGRDDVAFPHPTATCRTTASNTIWTNINATLRIAPTNPYGGAIVITNCNQDRALIQQTVPVEHADFIAGRLSNTAHVGGGVLQTAVNKPADQALANRRALRRTGGTGATNGSIDMNNNRIYTSGTSRPEPTIMGHTNVDRLLMGDGRMRIGAHGSTLPHDTPRTIGIDYLDATELWGPRRRPTFFTAPSVAYGGHVSTIVLMLEAESQVNADGAIHIDSDSHIDIYRDRTNPLELMRPTIMYNPVINKPDGTVVDVLSTAPAFYLRWSGTLTAGTQTPAIPGCPTSAGINPAPEPPIILLSVAARATTGRLADGTVLPDDGPRYYQHEMLGTESVQVRPFVTPTPTMLRSGCYAGNSCYSDSVTVEAYCRAVL